MAAILSALASACGCTLDVDAILASWGHVVPEPDFDPGASHQAILAGFGGS